MNKTIKFFTYFGVLLLMFITSSFLMESCKGKGDNDVVYEESDDSEFSSDEEIYEEYFESDEEASEKGVEAQDVVASDNDSEDRVVEQDATDYDEDFSFEASSEEKASINQAKEKPQASARKVSAPRTNANNSTSGASYFVVAGTYLIKDNAKNMVGKLENMGYSSVEILQFDDSKYHTITAGRYGSYDSASEVAAKLKQKGIDCYVHTRQ